MAKKTKPEAVTQKIDDDYETQSNMDTIMRAREIEADEEKMEKIHKLAGRKKKLLEGLSQPKKIRSMKDLKDTYNKKFGPKE